MKAQGNGPAFILQTYEDRLNNNAKTKELTERLAELQNSVTEETKRLTTSKANSAESAPPPPPPPPQCSSVTSSVSSTPPSSAPSTRSNTLKSTKVKPKAPPVPVKYSVLSYTSQNGFKKATNGFASPAGNGNQPPPCPSPDYDTLSLASSTSSSAATRKASTGDKESAEMESLESFRINNPANVKPRPPSTYFHKRILSNTLSNQSSSSNVSTIRRNRPVSITIGEYPSMRRQPGKLDFLQASQDAVDIGGNDESLGNRLSSELAQTLKRSNLKLRTESMENLLDNSSHKPSQIKTQKNGAVRISLNNLSKAFAKSTSDLTEDFDDHYDTLPLRNRVTINVHLMKPNETPNGILKNGNPDCALSSGHKIVTPQKSITFGEMPTLIKDKSSGKS